MYDIEINIGSSKLTVRVHPNAPQIVNFYTVKGNSKRYNKNTNFMKHCSDNGAEWTCQAMNRLHGSSTKVYYVAS